MRILLSIVLIGLLSGVIYAQDNNMDPTDHEIATWQFRSISPSDVANFLSNEDNVFRKAVKSAIADGRMRHWGLLRKVNGNTSSGHNYFFYNGFNKITDLDNSPWGAGSSFGLKPVKSAGVLGTVHTSPAIQVFADNPKPGSYLVINYANPNDLDKFIQLQNDVWKPFIKNFINDPESSLAGWEVHRVVSPTGNAYNWNVATIDHYTSLSGAMNPFPNGFDWPEGLEEINNLLPNGKFTRSVIYEVVFYEGLDASK